MARENDSEEDDNMFLDDPETMEDEEEIEFDDDAIELDSVRAERDEMKDRLLRALAENENFRKRAERDRRDAELYGGVRLARDLLSVYDNLGRALEIMTDELRKSEPGLSEGIELTQKDLLAVFQKHKIEKIEPVIGEKFDAKLHQAMFEAPVPDYVAGAIIQILAPGFMIGERLLRAAQVGISSGAVAQAPVDG